MYSLAGRAPWGAAPNSVGAARCAGPLAGAWPALVAGARVECRRRQVGNRSLGSAQDDGIVVECRRGALERGSTGAGHLDIGAPRRKPEIASPLERLRGGAGIVLQLRD